MCINLSFNKILVIDVSQLKVVEYSGMSRVFLACLIIFLETVSVQGVAKYVREKYCDFLLGEVLYHSNIFLA